jgi:hypothetical protein
MTHPPRITDDFVLTRWMTIEIGKINEGWSGTGFTARKRHYHGNIPPHGRSKKSNRAIVRAHDRCDVPDVNL